MTCQTFSSMENYGILYFLFYALTLTHLLPGTRFGHDNFQEALKMASRVIAPSDWSKLKYMVFDIPNNQGLYSARYSILGKIYISELYIFIKL